MTETITTLADIHSKHPELAKDAEWGKVETRLRHLLSDEGLREANNPFAQFITNSRLNALQQGLQSAAQKKDPPYMYTGGSGIDGFRHADGSDLNDQERKALALEGNNFANREMEKLKEGILVNAAKGYLKEDPIPAGKFLEGGLSGAIDQVTSFNFGGIIGGFMSGVGSAVKDFVFNIPIVGDFISQLNNWVGHNVGAWFSKDKEAISWEKAGEMAVAQRNAKHVANGLAVFSDLDVDAVTKQMEHGLTYGFPAPATETPSSARTTSTTPATTPAADPNAPAAQGSSAAEPASLQSMLQDDRIDANEFKAILETNITDITSNTKQDMVNMELSKAQPLLSNQNVVMVRLGEDPRSPIAFGTQGSDGKIQDVHVVIDNEVYRYKTAFDNIEQFKASGQTLKDPHVDGFQEHFEKIDDNNTVLYDDIATQITKYMGKLAQQSQAR